MIISQIAAMASNRVIGKNNELPWHIPEDLKFFKNKTKGHIMIMGRKTFESMGGALPTRHHIVITRSRDYKVFEDRVLVVGSVEEAIVNAKSLVPPYPDEIFIIGGGEIYKQSLPFTDRIYLTEIAKPYEGDAHFPEFSKEEFKLVNSVKHTSPQDFCFNAYERVK